MRLVCAGVANGISHTTSGEPTTSTVVLDRVTGQPIALFGVGGGVVRSLMSLFSGDLRRFPPCIVVLSPSVMTFVDLPVYLRLMTLQNVKVTVMAPASVLDAVVQYIEDVLAEEDATVGIAVQKMTQFVDLDTDVPVVLPTRSTPPGARDGSSSGGAPKPSHTHALGGGGLATALLAAKDIQSAFEDVIFSQWLLFLQSSKSSVREDHYLFNAVLVHRRVVINGASKHKDAVAAALTTAMSAAGSLSAADGVVKEDTTTMLAVVGHLPTGGGDGGAAGAASTTSAPGEAAAASAAGARSLEYDVAGMMFLLQCDAIVTTMNDEAFVRTALASAQAAAAAVASAASSRMGTPPVHHLMSSAAGDNNATTAADVVKGGAASSPKEKGDVAEPFLILTRFAAHEPPLTFHPKTFVAQRGVEYRVAPNEGVVQLGVLHGPALQKRQKSTAAAQLSPSSPQGYHSGSPLGAKLVDDDNVHSSDDDVDQQVLHGDDYRLHGVGSATIGALRRDQQRRRLEAAAQQHQQKMDEAAAASPKEQNAFALSLRAEHYDAEMSQLAEMRRQLGVPYVAEGAVPVNWGAMGGAGNMSGTNSRGVVVGRHTAARLATRAASSPSSQLLSNDLYVGQGASPSRGSRLAAPVGSTLTKPASPTQHYRCLFLRADTQGCFGGDGSLAGCFEYGLQLPGDPLDCAPLNIHTATQGRMDTIHQYLLTPRPDDPKWERSRGLCLQVLRAVQFGTAMVRATHAMVRAEFIPVDVVTGAAMDGTWLAHLQGLLNEALYNVLVNVVEGTQIAPPRTARRSTASASTMESVVTGLQRSLKAVCASSERWVRWTTLQYEPLLDYSPFLQSGAEAMEFSILVHA